MSAGRFSKIRFGDGLTVTDEGANVIRVDAAGGGTVDISGKVDRDAVEAATNRLVAVKLAAGDTQLAFRINGDGKLAWGPGGTTPLDTALYRPAANQLRTDGRLIAGDGSYSVIANPAAVGGYVLGDFVGAETQPRFRVRAGDGAIEWGPGGTTAPDTALYRSAVNTVITDGNLIAGKQLAPAQGPNVVLASNTIAITGSSHAVTGTGPLKTITGAAGSPAATLLVLYNASGAAITVDSTNNIYATAGGGSFAWPAGSVLLAVFVFANWHVLAWQP